MNTNSRPPVNGRFHFSRKNHNPMRQCVECLYSRVGLGKCAIARILHKKTQLIIKWSRHLPKMRRHKRIFPEFPFGSCCLTDEEMQFRVSFYRLYEVSHKMFSWDPLQRLKSVVRKELDRRSFSILDDWRRRRRITSRAREVLHLAVRHKNPDVYWELTGCTSGELRSYIQSKFERGMHWNNRGQWHLDHIVPCSAFNLEQKSQLLKCFHYTKLQPLWQSDNLKKHAKVLPCQPELPIQNKQLNTPVGILFGDLWRDQVTKREAHMHAEQKKFTLLFLRIWRKVLKREATKARRAAKLREWRASHPESYRRSYRNENRMKRRMDLRIWRMKKKMELEYA